MRLLVRVAKDLPIAPSRETKRRNRPSPWLVSFVRDSDQEPASKKVGMEPEERASYGLHLVKEDYLTDQERSELEPSVAGFIERFRRRLAVSEASVARFALAGATRNHGGRVPGIAEELMLTLALKKPIYVAGGFGGAAQDVGSLLGLGKARMGEVPKSLDGQSALINESKLAKVKDKLRPGPWSTLPITARDVVSFLKSHAIGGPKWPDNGLSADENRLLFTSTEPAKVAELVVKGLRTCFGTT